MLPKNLRMTKKRDFEIVLKHGRWFKAEQLSLKLLKLSEINKIIILKKDLDKVNKQLKIAVSVGIKYSKKAVERNKLRRQIFEAVQPLITKKLIEEGGYILIVPNLPKTAIKNIKHIIPFAEISKEIKLLFIKSKLIND
ncbi:MAG: ribonuclease P protein component [Patescibacteria group bacterium]|jgi:ribonuclease P protein component